MEKKRLIAKQYEVDLFCDECGGKMGSDNVVIDTYPAQYSYYCPKCGCHVVSIKYYPYMMAEKGDLE